MADNPNRVADSALRGFLRALNHLLTGYRADANPEGVETLITGGWNVVGRLMRDFEERRSSVTDELFEVLEKLVLKSMNAESKRLSLRRFRDEFGFVNPETVAFLERYSLALITGLEDDAREAIRQVLLRGQRDGIPPRVQAKQIAEVIGLTPSQTLAVLNASNTAYQEAIDAGKTLAQAVAAADRVAERHGKRLLKYRAETIARSETIRAQNAGQQAVWDQYVREGLLPSNATKVWISTPDGRRDVLCQQMEGREAPIGGTFDSPVGQVEYPPLHPRCLPGDSRVSAEGVSATSERWYDGPLVVINTASGKHLSCTPNHPILTPHGWVAAGLLNEGGYVISSALDQWMDSRSDSENQNVPSRIEDVVEAFGRAEQVTAMPVPLAAEDFHGDGAGSKVAVIRTNGLLRDSVDAASAEHASEGVFSRRSMEGTSLNRRRMLELGFEGYRPAFGGRMGGFDLGGPLLRWHGRPLEQLSFAPASRGDASFEQSPTNRISIDAVMASEREFRFPGLVSTGYLRDGQVVRWNLRAGAKTVRREIAPDSPMVPDVELAHQLTNGLAGPVFSDQIVGVNVRDFSGHVFNLQTAGGYYVAEGILTHNCRCAVGVGRV